MPPPKHVHPGRLVVSKPDLPMTDSGEAARPCPHQDYDRSANMPARCRRDMLRCIKPLSCRIQGLASHRI